MVPLNGALSIELSKRRHNIVCVCVSLCLSLSLCVCVCWGGGIVVLAVHLGWGFCQPHHVQHCGCQINVDGRLVESGAGSDPRALDKERYPDVRLVKHSLVVEHTEFA